jgi:hypothetical protein
MMGTVTIRVHLPHSRNPQSGIVLKKQRKVETVSLSSSCSQATACQEGGGQEGAPYMCTLEESIFQSYILVCVIE